MNREIKFRAINADGEMIYGLPYTDGTNDTVYFKEYNNRLCWRNDEGAHCNQPYKNGTLMQFTGLTDKNGKDIYEDDWCEAEFRDRHGITVIQGRIIMDDFMWCIDCRGCVGDDIFSINRPHNFKVIDNIYENPELLAQQ